MDNKNGPPQQSVAAHFHFQVGSYILIGDTGGDGEVRIDGVESEGLRGVGRGMGIISGAAVSEVALAESLIGARAVASKANGSFSGRVLKYYCSYIFPLVVHSMRRKFWPFCLRLRSR